MPNVTPADADPPAVEAAAARLAAARATGKPIARLPENLRPTTVAAALAVQRRVTALAGATVGGWKCALPTPAKTVVAPIYAADIARRSPCPAPAAAGQARVEPEIAFVVAKPLPPRTTAYTDDELREAIAGAHLVLEIIGTRYAEPSGVPAIELLADNAGNAGLFVGPAIADPFGPGLDAFGLGWGPATGALQHRDVRHPDGHPLRPFAWLANTLGSLPGGEAGLRVGDVVTTGSYAGVLDVPAGIGLRFVFGTLGEFTVLLRPAAESP